jgi:hypothetical protein
VGLFDLSPEALEAVGDHRRVMGLVGAGFVLFFVADRFLVLTICCRRPTITRRCAGWR